MIVFQPFYDAYLPMIRLAGAIPRFVTLQPPDWRITAEALERMEKIVVPHQVISPGSIRLKKPERSGQEVAKLENIGLTYDGKTWVLKGADLSIQRGDKVAFVGLNGTGKSTFLRIIAGSLPPSEGTRTLGYNVVPGYQSQEFAETMDPDLTVYETVKSVGDAKMQEVRTLLGGFGFSGDTVEKKVSVLSGGEKVRLAFARLLINPPNFLILDEPTTHLDIAAREALEVALREFKGTICFVSHDIQFVKQVATSIAAMRPPSIRIYCGGYDYYCERMAAENPVVTVSETAKSKDSERKIQRRERAEIVQERGRRKKELATQLSEAEKLIDILESEEKELIAKLESGSGGASDYANINRRLYEIHIELPKALHEWETVSTKLEKLTAEPLPE